MKNLVEFLNHTEEQLINEWSQSERDSYKEKMKKAFSKLDSEEILNLLWDTFTDKTLEELYDEMDACGYFD